MRSTGAAAILERGSGKDGSDFAASVTNCGSPVPRRALLTFEVTVTHQKEIWTYTLTNRGKLPVDAFELFVEGQVKVVGSPKGWRGSDGS